MPPEWDAGGADMKVGKQQALFAERVDRWSLQDGVAKAVVIAVRQIVWHHDDDVGSGGFGFCKHRERCEHDEEEEQ